jgi:protein ImuB
MFACVIASSDSSSLATLAQDFSPTVELTEPGTVIFAVSGLERLIGPPGKVAEAILRRAEELSLTVRIGMAATPDAAHTAARHCESVAIIPPGQENEHLGQLPIHCLPGGAQIMDTMSRYGIRTWSDFAAIPPLGLVERFGLEALQLQDIARGAKSRPLRLLRPAAIYETLRAFEEPIADLDSLLFVLGQMLVDFCLRLESNRQAASEVLLRLGLERMADFHRQLSLPFPLSDPRALIKLLRLDLEAHPPGAAVHTVHLHLLPVSTRLVQHGLFTAGLPEPAKLQLILARIAAVVGEDNVGSPVIEDTHRPDPFHLAPVSFDLRLAAPKAEQPDTPPLARRLFRPALRADVITRNSIPMRVAAPGVMGRVLNYAGPWKSSGGWWTRDAWQHNEWDVSLSDGAVYRIYQSQLASAQWFVEGVYD